MPFDTLCWQDASCTLNTHCEQNGVKIDRMLPHWAAFVAPLIALFVAGITVLAFDVDMVVARWGFDGAAKEPWIWADVWLWRILTDYGHLPGILLGVTGAALLLKSLVLRRVDHGLWSGLFLVVSVLVGPLLLVNVVIKDAWHRPRPREIVQFGGTEHFSSFAVPGSSENSKSFPSGHASIAFYLMTPAFIFLRWRRPRWAAIWLSIGFGYGFLMGASRILHGAHFVSDILGSAVVVYLTGWGLSCLLLPAYKDESQSSTLWPVAAEARREFPPLNSAA